MEIQGRIGLGKERPWWRIVLLVAVAAALTLTTQSAPAVADVGDIGYQDQSFAGISTPSTPTGTKRAESVLWFNDGIWWADMWDTVSQDYHIFKLDTGTQTWSDTGTTIDPRITSHADVLWDGVHLYVASHQFVNDEIPSATGGDSRLYRYSYDTGTQTYSLDAGFPTQINTEKTETLVIDKDSAGRIWATWQQDNQIYVNSTQGDDHTWGTPFALPEALATNLTVDDNSALVAFGGGKIGVMWSNQSTGNDGMYFAVHNDGDPDATWQPATPVIQGGLVADDHMNLKALSDGRVLAATKTSNTDYRLPLTMLHVRDPATGSWSNYTISTADECPNRPTVLVDEANDKIHVLQTGPAPPDLSCNTTGGAIYEKTSSLSSPSFESGYGTLVMLDADSAALHNVSSTKQNVSPTTGLAALAINATTKFYWHLYQLIGPPPPVADFTGAPTSGVAPLDVSFTDASTNNVASWSWDFGDGTNSSDQNPTHTYAQAGTYTVSLTVTGDGGSDTMTKVGYITVTPPSPVADFTATPTSGFAPLAVSFADTSANNPTKWAWTFGDGGTSTSKNPSHTYKNAGSYTVTLKATNAVGSDTETKVGYITVSPPPPDFTLVASPDKRDVPQGKSTTFDVTIDRKNGFVGTVSLSVDGLPSGATATFSKSSVTVPPKTTVKLTVTASRSTPIGLYTLTVTGVSGSLSHTDTVKINVKKA